MGLVSLETVRAKKRYSETELARVETIYIIREKIKLGECRNFLLVHSMRSQETHIG